MAEEVPAGAVLCVYVLRNAGGRTYVGFTNAPARRLRQHNGEVKGGARKTRLGRPWEMIGFVHGFRTKVSALQFEWAWQHPTMSRFLKGGALNGLKVGKRSFAAATRLQVVGALLACDDFAEEPLGVHLLDGLWAPPGAAGGSSIDPRLHDILSAAIRRQQWRVRGPPPMTHGDPVAAGVLPARRPRGGARLAEVADVFMDDDEDAEEDGWEHALLIGSSSSSGGEESEDEHDGGGAQSGEREAAVAHALRCPDESSDESSGEEAEVEAEVEASVVVDLTADDVDDSLAGSSGEQAAPATPAAASERAGHRHAIEPRSPWEEAMRDMRECEEDTPLAERLARRREAENTCPQSSPMVT